MTLYQVSQDMNHLFQKSSQKYQLVTSLISRLARLVTLITNTKKNILTRDRNYYMNKAATDNPPPQSGVTPGYYLDVDEQLIDNLIQEHDSRMEIWEEELNIMVYELTTRDQAINLRLDYCLNTINHYLLDLTQTKNSKSPDDRFGIQLHSINDIKVNSYLWLKDPSSLGQSINNLVYVMSIDYVLEEIWYQSLETSDPRGITNLERKFDKTSMVLKSASFSDFIPVQPQVYYSRNSCLDNDLINNWLLEAVNNGSNIEARQNMLSAASMGSTAFQKGLGAIHSLSHPVNALNNLHHGLSNAIFMPYVLTFNRDVIESKVVKIAEYLELKDKSFDGFLKWILDLREEFEIPHKLSSVINEKDLQIDRLSKMALDDPSTNGNPKKLKIEDMKNMYQHSMSGNLF